jgi:hypothetical protein
MHRQPTWIWIAIQNPGPFDRAICSTGLIPQLVFDEECTSISRSLLPMRRTSSKVLPPSIKSLRQDENAHMKKGKNTLLSATTTNRTQEKVPATNLNNRGSWIGSIIKRI